MVVLRFHPMSWGSQHSHHLQHPSGDWAPWARISHPVSSPGCCQAVTLALSCPSRVWSILQGKKPTDCHAMAVNFAHSNVCLVPILYARRGSLKALPRAGSPGQPHSKNTIALDFSWPPWRNQGSWRREGGGLQVSVPTCKPQQQLMWPIEHIYAVKCDVMLVASVFPERAPEQRPSSPWAHFSSLESHLLWQETDLSDKPSPALSCCWASLWNARHSSEHCWSLHSSRKQLNRAGAQILEWWTWSLFVITNGKKGPNQQLN